VKSQRPGKKTRQVKEKQSLNRIVERNIHAIIEHRDQSARNRTMQERISDAITNFSGSMIFVVLHILFFGAWFVLNAGWFGLTPFDPFPYGLLTMIVSLEAIFLSTFVLISQNRMSEQDRERAELDLQINLLTEHELTRVLQMLDEIQDYLGIENERDRELRDLEKETKPEEIMKVIEREEFGKRNQKS
jgi:uncharacterized membrane protein